MADITMCRNSTCPQRALCFRYMAFANPARQSMSTYKPVNGECDHFWDMRQKGLQWYEGQLNTKELAKELANMIAEDFESLSNSSAKSILEDTLKELLK